MFRRRSEGARSKVSWLAATLVVLWGAGQVGATVSPVPFLPVPAPEKSGSAAAIAENPFAELANIEKSRLEARAGKPEAVAPLLALFALADVLPPGHLDPLVKKVLESGPPGGTEADPLVAARARDWLARRLEEKGDEAGGAAVRKPLGILSRFWIVGPFGDGRASLDVPYPPETEVDLPDAARSYVGKERKVEWRRAEGALRRGMLDLSALIRPDNQAAAYASTFVKVEKATRAALRLGGPGPVKVWCNGRLAHSSDRVRSARFDQDAVGIQLVPGWNRLLIKTVVTEGGWRLFARLTGVDGNPLGFTDAWQPDPTTIATPRLGRGINEGQRQAAPAVQLAMPLFRVRALEPILRQRVRSARSAAAAAAAQLDLGRYLLMVDAADRDQKEAARAFEASAARIPTVEALMGLASAAREEDESRRALERALTLPAPARDRAAVLTALGDVARDQHRDSVAVSRWRDALAADPRWWPAALSLAGEEVAAGFPAAALARIQSLPAAIRALRPVIREQVRMLVTLHRNAEAESLRRTLLPEGRDNADLMRELASAARARGDAAESLRLIERAATLRPDLTGLTIEWATALEGSRQPDVARRVLEAAARRIPAEPAFASELGKLLDRMGKREPALSWLRTALELRPQDPELRRYAEALNARVPGAATAGERKVAVSSPAPVRSSGPPSTGSPSAPDHHTDLARRFAAPVSALLVAEASRKAAASSAGAPARAEPDPATVLLDRRAVRVHPNGLSQVFAQRVVEVRTDSGAEDNKDFLVRYTPGSEDVEILEARIFRRGVGGVVDILQASDRDDQDLSEPWYGLYYDYRAQVVRFEGLRAGDVLEVQYVVSDVSRENQLAGYFGDLQYIAETIPKRQWDYTLLAPPGRDFYFARPVIPGLDETSSSDGGERITRFAARDVPRIEIEPAMPGIAEVSPYLHISTYKTWEDVGNWYWRLVEEQLVPDDSVRRAAEKAVQLAQAAMPGKGGRALTDLDKVRILHSLVLGGTRYVGLEFGIHGFKPYKVSQVLARKFGDCKDKAALLTALLSQVGVDAEMVLLRTRRGGRIAPVPASLAVFDHAIVYIPKLGLYLDGTAEFSGMKELPGQDQGVMVLRVSGRGIKLVHTPVLPSSENRAVRAWTVRVDADGDAEVDEQLSIDGQAAPEWRSHYQTVGERMDRYAKVWSGRNPGARLETVDMPGLDDRNRPVVVRAKARVPRLAERTSGGGLLLMLGARDADLVRTYARLSSRRSDLVLAYPWQHQEAIKYQLPQGYRATSLPHPRRIESKFGHFELRVGATATGTVTTEARLDVQRDRIGPGDYGDFRKFLAEVDAVMAERIAVEPAPPSPARSEEGRSKQRLMNGEPSVVHQARGVTNPGGATGK